MFHLLSRVKNKEQNILFDKKKDIEEGKTIEQQYKTFCSAKAAIVAQERHSKTVLMNNYQKEIMLKKVAISFFSKNQSFNRKPVFFTKISPFNRKSIF